MKEDRAIGGLEILRMILRYYQTNKTADTIYNLTDLQRVRMKGSNAEGFQNTWTTVLKGMRKQPDEDVLEFLYFERVEKFHGIAEDIVHYSRLEEGSGGDRSYDFLFTSVQRYPQRTRQAKVREEIIAGLGGRCPEPQALRRKPRPRRGAKPKLDRRRQHQVVPYLRRTHRVNYILCRASSARRARTAIFHIPRLRKARPPRTRAPR